MKPKKKLLIMFIHRLLTETVKQSQDWGSSQDWDEIEVTKGIP